MLLLLLQLPDSLTTLSNLRVLGLTSNRLWQLPPGIAGCSSLRVLDCSHNLLSRLPAGMGEMPRLRSVKLTHNKLGWVPVWEFQELPGLQELHLAGNAFTVGWIILRDLVPPSHNRLCCSSALCVCALDWLCLQVVAQHGGA
jgi:hypothetical protein